MTIKSIKPRISKIDTRVGASPATERIRGSAHIKIRERILLRDGDTCRSCGHVSRKLIIDHITPLHLGGCESDGNRQAICKACHKAKNDKEGKRRALGGMEIQCEK